LFIYVSAKSLKKPEVKSFMDYYLNNAAKYTTEVGYIPLQATDYAAASTNIQKKRYGSIFSSTPSAGMKIAELLKLTPKQ
jgi:phosphate transport system substrate-binding protein